MVAQAAKYGGVAPSAGPARTKMRHIVILLSFLVMVVLPGAGTSWYLWQRAADQYASTVAFSVRREEVNSASDILGGLRALSGSSSSDTDILYEFLQSQKLVYEMNKDVDLVGAWSKPENDPFFSYDPGGSIEDLVDYWDRMVKIYYDSGAGLIEVRVLAFEAADATKIAQAILSKSSDMINELSAIAREDALGYARDELAAAVERLKLAREALTRFRNKHQLVDPSVDIQTQAGLLGNLQGQLAESLIEVDILNETTLANDPRLNQARRRVEVIENRIAAERRKLGIGSQIGAGEVFADLVGEYERLVVDREFAERTYTSALAAFDSTQAETRRKSRYLAAYVLPTTAETSRYPERFLLLALISLFTLLAWSITVLVAYSLKDRR